MFLLALVLAAAAGCGVTDRGNEIGEGTGGQGDAADNQVPPSKSNFSVEAAEAFTGWPLYWPGPTASGLPLTAVLRHEVTDPLDPEITKIRPNYVSFLYGDCPTTADGCAPPIQIQITPACNHTAADLQRPNNGTVMIRGVEATFFEGRAKLVVVAGESTITIYGRSARDVVRTANELEGVNVDLARTESLPPPQVPAERC